MGVPPSGGGRQNLWFCLTPEPVALVPTPTGALGLVTHPPCPTGLLWSLRVVIRVGQAGHSLERRQAKVSYNSSTLAGASGDLTRRTVCVMDSYSMASSRPPLRGRVTSHARNKAGWFSKGDYARKQAFEEVYGNNDNVRERKTRLAFRVLPPCDVHRPRLLPHMCQDKLGCRQRWGTKPIY